LDDVFNIKHATEFQVYEEQYITIDSLKVNIRTTIQGNRNMNI